jgi:hypothetical protein
MGALESLEQCIPYFGSPIVLDLIDNPLAERVPKSLPFSGSPTIYKPPTNDKSSVLESLQLLIVTTTTADGSKPQRVGIFILRKSMSLFSKLLGKMVAVVSCLLAR